jgi:hypothetical protein
MAISTVAAELHRIRDILLGTRRPGIGQHEIILSPEGTVDRYPSIIMPVFRLRDDSSI